MATIDLGKITASVTVGSTTTGDPGSSASVTNSGTTQDAVFDFTIPRGDKGDTVILGNEEEYTLYNVQGNSTVGAMTQDATTKSISAQTGYYTCETAGGTAAKVASGDNLSLYTLTSGGHFKIKMTYENSAENATLKLGNADAKPLYYNGERAGGSNSWEENEVLSVYYDGTNYQASNSMGGGGASGIKELKGITGAYIVNNGDTLGQIVSTSAEAACYQYIKYPVNEGDVVMVSGKSATSALLWGIVGDNNAMIAKAAEWAYENGLVLIMPEGARFITLNSMIADSEQYHTIDSHPKWYYAKKGSFGTQELFAQAYLYGDLRTLAVGQVYGKNEAVKTSDKQLLRVTKEVKAMNITDVIAVGDLKTYGIGANASTYKALKEVKVYNGTETEGLYAIGRPSLVTITVDSSSLSIEEDTDVEVTIGEVTQTITVPAAASETKNADIAALIAAAFTSVPGWTLTDNEDGTLTLRCNTGGANTITVSSNVEETGLSITSSAVNGATTLSKYVEGTWTAVTLADYATDSINPGETADGEMWQKLTLEELISYATVQDTLINKFVADELHKSMLNLYVKANAATPVNNPLNLEAGKTYRIVIKLSAVATGSSKGFYLRQVYNQSSPNKQLAIINVGYDTADFEYTPPESSNYQYISAWTSSGAFTYSVYIYEKKQINKVPKIYNELGNNDNGSISQKALTEILNKGTFETLIETNINTSILTKTSGSLGSGKKWIFNNDCNHVVIPCTEGDEFNLTPTANNFWGWLRDYTIPKNEDSILYTSGEDRHWSTYDKPKTAPAGVKYLCLVTKNGDGNSSTWTGTAKIKAPLYDILNNTVSKEEFEASLDAEIAQFKSEFSDDVNKYIFTPSSYIPITESHEVYGSTHCYQGCALYGNYLVSISNSSITQLCIYNLETKTVIASSIALPTFSNTRFHGNTLSFSNTKYDANDEFPLLYCCAGATTTTSVSTSQVYVIRIINNEGVYSTELIQTITIDFGVINGWNEFVVDAENNRAWITGSGKRFYICVALPSIGEDVTINNDTPLIDSFDVKHARTGVATSSSGQNKFFYKGRIYSANGVPDYTGQGVDALYISVDNTLTHCREAVASLKNYGITQEPEACFIWRNELYVVMRLGTIHKLIQN